MELRSRKSRALEWSQPEVGGWSLELGFETTVFVRREHSAAAQDSWSSLGSRENRNERPQMTWLFRTPKDDEPEHRPVRGGALAGFFLFGGGWEVTRLCHWAQ